MWSYFMYPPISVPIDKDDNTAPFPSLSSTDPKTNFFKDFEENTINTNPKTKTLKSTFPDF